MSRPATPSSAFQSTRPRGARRPGLWPASCAGGFQSTRPRGARPGFLPAFLWSTEFQSTRPRGARLCRGWDEARREIVSIHAPAWGATHGFQPGCARLVVSIHAPAWGATCRGGQARSTSRVSIHAPAWGATAGLGRRRSGRERFNPRARVGRDPAPPRPGRPFPVSIHAPAWGATSSASSTWRATLVSIHAPAWGATGFLPAFLWSTKFQSTRPRGARPR